MNNEVIEIGNYVTHPDYNKGKEMEVTDYRGIESVYKIYGEETRKFTIDKSNVWCRWFEDGKQFDQELPVSIVTKVR